MLDALRTRITYANAMSTAAVFIALGGTSYAALTLPRNSVGSNQIRTGAVGASEIHDRSVGVKDMTVAARAALKGSAGPMGPAGTPGASAVKYFATATASGDFVRGNATSGGRAGSPGVYVVGFAGPVSACAFSAVLGTADGSTVAPGRITVNEQGGKVGVQTYDAAGTAADLPFHLVVAC